MLDESPRPSTKTKNNKPGNSITPGSSSTGKKSRKPPSLTRQSSCSEEENNDPANPSGSDSQRSTSKHRRSAGTSQQIADLKSQHKLSIMARSQEAKRLEKENRDLRAKYDALEAEKAAAEEKAKAEETGKKALQIRLRTTLAKVGGTKTSDNLKNQAMVSQVKRIVKKKLWAYVKFLGNDKQLADATLLCIDLMKLKDYLHVDGESVSQKEMVDEMVAEFQMLYSTDVRSATNEQRSYVQGEMKKLYINYRISGGDPISYVEFEKVAMRNVLDNNGNPDPRKEQIFDLYVHMLSACAGSSTYGEKQRRTTPISTAVTDAGTFAVPHSTEGMTLVMFDNCVEKWDQMYKFKHEDNQPGNIPKYSPKKHEETKMWRTKYSDACSGNSPYGGWGKDGIKAFIKVTKKIKNLRETKSEDILEVENAAVGRFRELYREDRKRKAQLNGREFDDSDDDEGSPASKKSKSDDDDEVLAEFDLCV